MEEGEIWGRGVYLRKTKGLQMKEECCTSEEPILAPTPEAEVTEVTAPGY